jgi:hypothetical protein
MVALGYPGLFYFSAGGGSGETPIGTPTNIEVIADELSYSATWDAVPDVDGYIVQIDSGLSVFTPINAISGTTFAGDHDLTISGVRTGSGAVSDIFTNTDPTPVVVQPTVIAVKVSAEDSAEGSITPNDQPFNVTVPPGFQGILLAVMHAELQAGLEWNLFLGSGTGERGRPIFTKDGYAGDLSGTYVSGNKLLRAYYWRNPPIGAQTFMIGSLDNAGTGTFSSVANELACVVMLIDNVADVDFPFRSIAEDVSASHRGSDSLSLSTHASDLLLHIVGHSQTIANQGSGTGETMIAQANDNTGDSSLWIASKNPVNGTSTLGVTGFNPTFCLQGYGLAVMGYGELEYKNELVDYDSTDPDASPVNPSIFETPYGNAPGQINLVGGIIKGNNAGENVAKVISPSFGADQYVEMTWNGVSTYSRVLARVQPFVASGYALTVESPSDITIRVLTDSGTIDYSNVLLSQTPFRNLVVGDRIGMYCHGSNPTVFDIYINGEQFYTVSETISSYTSGQPGVSCFASGNICTRFYASETPFRF